MGILIVAAVLGVLPAFIAHSKGRSFLLWWIYGMALFIIALPHSILAKSNKRRVEMRQLTQGMRKCTSCAEMIKREAIVCRFCGNGSALNMQHQQTISIQSPTNSSHQISDLKNSGLTLNEYYRQLNNKN